MFNFDLQIFSDEDETRDTEDSVEVGESVETEEPKEEIPEELAGLPEDIAREAMAEISSKEEPQSDDNEQVEETELADADSDNKQYSDLPNQRVPYGRFKAELDKRHELEDRLKELESKLNAPQQPTIPPQQSQQQYEVAQQTMQAPQTPRITPDIVAQINEAVKQQALQMTGFTAEDLDSFDYMEENDPRKSQYKAAYEMARMNVYAGIQQAQQQRAANAKHMIEVHNASVQDYNAFAQTEMAEPDFKDVSAYAIGDYFENGISKAEQPAIASAYQRIERNIASPEDIALIKRYYKDAKAAYRASNPAAAKLKANPMNKVKQAKSFPRSQNVDGVSDAGGAVTAETLEKMLNEENWDNIPKQYQNMLLGITSNVK